jgi:hypothetical protein
MPVNMERKFIKKIRVNCLVFSNSMRGLASIFSFQNLFEIEALGNLWIKEGLDSRIVLSWFELFIKY